MGTGLPGLFVFLILSFYFLVQMKKKVGDIPIYHSIGHSFLSELWSQVSYQSSPNDNNETSSGIKKGIPRVDTVPKLRKRKDIGSVVQSDPTGEALTM